MSEEESLTALGSKPAETVVVVDDVEATKVLSAEDALAAGWIERDTEKTKMVEFLGETIEIDIRKKVNVKGDKVCWIVGKHPGFVNNKHTFTAENIKGHKRPTGKRKKSLKSLFRQLLDAKPVQGEVLGIPDKLRYELEEQIGGVTEAIYVFGNDIDEVVSMERNGQIYYYLTKFFLCI